MFTKAVTYTGINATFRKGLRNGNWRRLRFLDKALYRASLWYAKRGRSIVNGLLVEKLLELVERLKEISKGMRIFKFRRGFKKAVAMLDRGEENFEGVFVGAPRLKDWLKDPDYIFWLGTNLSLNLLRKGLSTTFYKKFDQKCFAASRKEIFTNNFFFYLR